MRGFVLAREKVEQGHFPVADLDAAEEIFLTNSLRGIVSVRTWEGKPVRSSESATRLRAAYDAAVAAQVRG